MGQTTRGDLLAMAEHLEMAAGSVRLLDVAVATIIEAMPRADSFTPPPAPADFTPNYTGSLDAAIRLVPPWALWKVRNLWSGADYDRTACVAVVTAYRFPEQTVRFEREGHARTPALALCAATLRVLAGEG